MPAYARGPLSAKSVKTSERIAWLLRVNRRLGHDPRWVKANQFSDAFCGGCWPTSISGSTISRWENNLIQVPYLAICRYEEMLGLPAGTLVAVIDVVNRYGMPPSGGSPQLDRGIRRDRDAAIGRLDGLLDKVTSNEMMNGCDWDELTLALSTFPEIVLVPSSIWDELAGRLMAETLIAHGLPWMRRFESFSRLLGHPIGQRAAIAICVNMAADKTNQIIIEAISALDGTRHPDSSHHVFAQILNPTSDPAFYGALLASVRKTRYGHMAPRQVKYIAHIAEDLLAGPIRNDDAQVLAAQILHQLHSQSSTPLSARARRALTANRPLLDLVVSGQYEIQSSPIVASITRRVAALLPGESPVSHDKLLPSLLYEILFHPVLDTRLYTTLLVDATPYKQPLAVALASELASQSHSLDATLASSILGALRILAGAEQRPLIERLTVASGFPAPVTLSAARALGRIPGVSKQHYWKNAVSFWVKNWKMHRDSGSAIVLHYLVYALAMSEEAVLLAGIRSDASIPSSVREAAAWWLNLSSKIWASARL
jgi:hypothetical protein